MAKAVFELDDLEEEELTAEEKSAHEEMEAYFEKSLKNFKEGEIITGRVLNLSKGLVTVDVGFKSEGIINLSEFPEAEKDLQIGDEVEVFLERVEDTDGIVVLSKEKANKIKIWEKLVKAFEAEEIIEGTVVAKAKGGLTVDIGLKAFLPGSQIDLRPVRNLEKLLGEKFQMKIIKMNKKRGNIVLSRRILLEEERKLARAGTLQKMEEGNQVDGIVKNITDYGVFIDLGGIDGLLHITDMSWGRVNHPSEMFSLGDKVTIMVLKYDKEKERVSLGLKQITPDPWVDVDTKYPVNTRISGRVVSITDYGAFVELEKGIEGLVHVSEMSWSRHVKHPSKMVTIGDTVDAIVLTLDKDKKRISLGMKQIEPNPWESIEEKYPIGSQVEGVVRNLTDFGAFIELEDGVDGLIHISDLSWNKKIKHPSEVLKKKDKVSAAVLSIDKEACRISLGIKQLQDDPWDKVPEQYPIGKEVTGTIVKVTGFGAFAEFDDGLEGLIHVSQLSSEKVTHPEKVVKEGDEIKAKVIKVDPASKKIGLSIKAYQENLDPSQIDLDEVQLDVPNEEEPSSEE
ncbi:MAG: 30S ribosomal protein S1 [Nitrospinaceae bacterium]|nr:30S ribosomal protein S1 [Nitrospinaceae bacterium]NIR57156.1 30S ribosomal protein S1 [Nitrospinaceae bacterium]NIS87598.1 30S ribosomal protein S1 [Nitrospinaceae bacterium]NIT84469.1 30S ribosomal protein S1 [Nitrospinaceae bacterium]NIU46655.1 30S ribosomal protein S1 [Nitrospinaceae bacterium]